MAQRSFAMNLWEHVKAWRKQRVTPLEEIRAKDGNLSIPLCVAPVAANGASGTATLGTGKPDLAGALAAWMKDSGDVRRVLSLILERRS